MTRLVLMSDTHMRHGAVDVPDGDVLIHAGDGLAVGAIDEWCQFAGWLGSLPHQWKLYVPGNHDVYVQWAEAQCRDMLRRAGVTMLIDERVHVAGLQVYGSPWVPEYGTWAFMLERDGECLREKREEIPMGLDVLVTHGPPFGVLDRTSEERGGAHVGCALLASRLERLGVAAPRLHVFGHIHPSQGEEEQGGRRSVNVATTVKVVDL